MFVQRCLHENDYFYLRLYSLCRSSSFFALWSSSSSSVVSLQPPIVHTVVERWRHPFSALQTWSFMLWKGSFVSAFGEVAADSMWPQEPKGLLKLQPRQRRRQQQQSDRIITYRNLKFIALCTTLSSLSSDMNTKNFTFSLFSILYLFNKCNLMTYALYPYSYVYDSSLFSDFNLIWWSSFMCNSQIKTRQTFVYLSPSDYSIYKNEIQCTLH